MMRLDEEAAKVARAFWRRALGIRYEDGPWSLMRVDKGLRYGLKSLFHQRAPTVAADRRHFDAMERYLVETPKRRVAMSSGLRICAIGDVMWVPRGWDKPVDVEVATLLSDADLRFANLETPVDPRAPVPKWTYASFNAPVSFIDEWRECIGATVFSLCNNHVLDLGFGGHRRTRESLVQRSMTPIGGPAASDACVVVNNGGKRIVVVGFTYGINPWGRRAGEGTPAGIPLCRLESAQGWLRVERLMAEARAHDADLIIVMPHWGFEFEYFPEEQQRGAAYRLVELGADLVLGSSPHVLQPVDVLSINGRDERCPLQIRRPGASRYGVVAYSLGNFFTSMPSAECRTGGVLSLALGPSKSTELDLRGLAFHPTVSVDEPPERVRRLPPTAKYVRHRRHAHAMLGPLCGDPIGFD